MTLVIDTRLTKILEFKSAFIIYDHGAGSYCEIYVSALVKVFTQKY